MVLFHERQKMPAGQFARPVALRPFLGTELNTEDWRVDYVAVDEVLRGRWVPLTRAEWDAVCAHLTALRDRFHGTQMGKPTEFTRRSGYYEVLKCVAHARGVSESDIVADLARYRERVAKRSQRAAERAAQRDEEK